MVRYPSSVLRLLRRLLYVSPGGGGGNYQIKKGQGSSSELLKKPLRATKILLRFRGLPLLHSQKQHIFYHIFCFTAPALYPEGTAKASAVEIMRLNTLKRTRTTFLTP